MNSIDSEIEVLKSIYEEELEVDPREDSNQPVSLHIKVKPNDESGTSSFVKVNFLLPPNYPESIPTITITNPRGISDGSCKALMKSIESFVDERKGENIIFDVLQLCSEFLVENQQTDESLCLICLELLNLHSVTITSCDHYLHEYCYKKYVVYRQKDLIKELEKLPKVMQPSIERTLHCPVCREILDDKLNLEIEKTAFTKAKKNDSTNNDVDYHSALNKWRQESKRLEEVFKKQKEQGGIIDEDEERMKNVITAETTVEIPVSQPSDVVVDTQKEVPSSSSAPRTEPMPKKKNYFGRNNYRGRGQRPKYPRNN